MDFKVSLDIHNIFGQNLHIRFQKKMKTLISTMIDLAKYVLKKEEVKYQKWAEKKNLEFTISQGNIWELIFSNYEKKKQE